MKYLAVLPYAYRPYFDECMKTCKFPRENMLIIDNTVNNIGIMSSHNMGVGKARAMGADWLIIMSAAVRFGKPGGLDFIEQLEAHPEYYIAQGEDLEAKEKGNKIFGWHFMAFKMEVFDNVGTWDQNFTPYGLDDIDLSLRIQKHYKGRPGWGGLPCDISDTTMGHSVHIAGVKSPYPPKEEYFRRKWGRGGAEYLKDGYARPFNNPDYPLSYWPSPGDPNINREAWGL